MEKAGKGWQGAGSREIANHDELGSRTGKGNIEAAWIIDKGVPPAAGAIKAKADDHHLALAALKAVDSIDDTGRAPLVPLQHTAYRRHTRAKWRNYPISAAGTPLTTSAWTALAAKRASRSA